MAKGQKTGGRRKGTLNKASADFKFAVSKLADEVAPDLKAWLLEIEDPAKRIDCAVRLFEYAHPKFSRLEHSGPDGGAVVIRKMYWPLPRTALDQAAPPAPTEQPAEDVGPAEGAPEQDSEVF
jgi:hypothetical protein